MVKKGFLHFNIACHKSEAGEENFQQLFHRIADYRWVEAHMIVKKQGNDLSRFVVDVATFVAACGNGGDEEVNRGVGLISDAEHLFRPHPPEDSNERLSG